MGDRVGVIFHEDWNEFSPIMYSHYGANSMPFQIQNYIKEYHEKYNIDDNSGHKYNPCHMMVGFIQYLDKDIHIRVESLESFQIDKLKNEHEYPNCFEGGCWIINVSKNNYGDTIVGDNYYLDNENIYKDELKSDY